jgi:hypothetical protein
VVGPQSQELNFQSTPVKLHTRSATHTYTSSTHTHTHTHRHMNRALNSSLSRFSTMLPLMRELYMWTKSDYKHKAMCVHRQETLMVIYIFAINTCIHHLHNLCVTQTSRAYLPHWHSSSADLSCVSGEGTLKNTSSLNRNPKKMSAF